MDKTTSNKKWLFLSIPVSVVTVLVSTMLVVVVNNNLTDDIASHGWVWALMGVMGTIGAVLLVLIVVAFMVLGRQISSTKLGQMVFSVGILMSMVSFFLYFILSNISLGLLLF